MRLSKYDHDVLSQLDELLLSENESVRELLQQAMVMQALSKEQDDDKLKDKVYGPFQKMMHAINEMQSRVQILESQLEQSRHQDLNKVATGGYWTDNTIGSGTYTGINPIWQTGLGPQLTYGNSSASSLDKDYMDKLSQWMKEVPKKEDV